MNREIINYLKEKPFEYQQSKEKFWDDEYISKQMLKAHLDPDFEGASRKYTFIQKSAEWIKDIVSSSNSLSSQDSPQAKKLLDLGCGPGVYTELFYDLGFQVTGIDYSKRSVEYARKSAESKGKKIDYYYQDYRNLNYENSFDVITLIYCDFGVLNPSDRALLLKNILRALKPQGLFIFDVCTWYQFKDFKDRQSVEYNKEGFWNENPYVCIKRDFRYDENSAFLEQYLILTENESKCYNNWNSAYDEKTLRAELSAAGFRSFDFYGDVSGKPRKDTDKEICTVARC